MYSIPEGLSHEEGFGARKLTTDVCIFRRVRKNSHMLRSRALRTAIVSRTSNVPEHDTGNCNGASLSLWYMYIYICM